MSVKTTRDVRVSRMVNGNLAAQVSCRSPSFDSTYLTLQCSRRWQRRAFVATTSRIVLIAQNLGIVAFNKYAHHFELVVEP
jgi:hypothetical protein